MKTVINMDNREESPDVAVYLVGGLGNQLFQLAAALTLAEGRQITLINQEDLARPNSNGFPAISDYQLPPQVKVVNGTGSGWKGNVSRRSLNYALRRSIYPMQGIDSGFMRSAVDRLIEFACEKSLGMPRSLISASTAGFDPGAVSTANSFLMVGYFQSWRYTVNPAVASVLHDMKLGQAPSWLEEIRIRANSEQPIIVQIRRGDYSKAANLGLLPSQYFQHGIRKLREELPENPLWIFSDDPTEALRVLPESELLRNPRVVPESGAQASAAETLEAMKLGAGYVISNSTFGWWGAWGAGVPASRVVVPEPWFADRSVVPDLIPRGWNLIPRDGE